jgi:hypothetical protein
MAAILAGCVLTNTIGSSQSSFGHLKTRMKHSIYPCFQPASTRVRKAYHHFAFGLRLRLDCPLSDLSCEHMARLVHGFPAFPPIVAE